MHCMVCGFYPCHCGRLQPEPLRTTGPKPTKSLKLKEPPNASLSESSNTVADHAPIGEEIAAQFEGFVSLDNNELAGVFPRTPEGYRRLNALVMNPPLRVAVIVKYSTGALPGIEKRDDEGVAAPVVPEPDFLDSSHIPRAEPKSRRTHESPEFLPPNAPVKGLVDQLKELLEDIKELEPTEGYIMAIERLEALSQVEGER